jgi:hypothetical protein
MRDNMTLSIPVYDLDGQLLGFHAMDTSSEVGVLKFGERTFVFQGGSSIKAFRFVEVHTQQIDVIVPDYDRRTIPHGSL